MPTDLTMPVEGVTRCPCGAKYWDGDVCASCGDRFRLHPCPDHFVGSEHLRCLTCGAS